jgi:hypothetical protein
MSLSFHLSMQGRTRADGVLALMSYNVIFNVSIALLDDGEYTIATGLTHTVAQCGQPNMTPFRLA